MEKKQDHSTDQTLVSAAPQSMPGTVDPAGALPAESGFAERYEQRSQLGQGGMGEVRLYRDRHIGRDVAMKLIRQEHGAHAEARARFLREARVQGQLEHPAIVPVYDLGLSPDGEIYFTMKRIRGISLEDILEGLRAKDEELTTRYTRHRLLTAFQNVCLAIDFAHRRGVLHRDLKPANIMLGDFGEVYLLDWGLARLADTAPEASQPRLALQQESPSHTIDGQMMGTPGYMAPEQVRGEVSGLTAQTDVYALGSILFEVLTLEHLHPSDRIEALLFSTLHGADARPSSRRPQAEVPPELEAICVKATALSPPDRFESARELHGAIERYLEGDRDLELRRELAQGHAQKAQAAAVRALEAAGSEADRALALREVSKALALSPQHREARRLLLRLLTEPPAHVPEGARAEINKSTLEITSLAALASGIAYLAWMPLLPIILWMGVKDWPAMVLSWGTVFLTGIIYLVGSRRPSMRFGYALAIGNLVAFTAGTRMFGPLLWLPGIVAMCSLSFAIQPVRRLRILALVSGCLTFAAPAALEWLGVLPSSYQFHDGKLTVVPQMLGLPETATSAFLLITGMAMVVTAFVFIGKIRDALFGAERRLRLQAWQLSQLVPEE